MYIMHRRIRIHKTSSQNNRRSNATAACVVVLLIIGFVLFTNLLKPLQKNSVLLTNRRKGFALPCVVLTQNTPRMDPSVNACIPFVGPGFKETELDFVLPSARNKVLHPELLETAQDLSNNASVNIYMNHVRMWAMLLTRKWDVALFLEDDAVVPSTLDDFVVPLLAEMHSKNVTNFVVKLVDHWIAWQWKSNFTVGNHDVRTCTCRPVVHSSSTAAYIMDKHAAHTLVTNAFPASMHVDSYVHNMGCTKGLIHLFQTYPHVVHYNNKPSTHLKKTSSQRMFLLVRELITNALNSNC